MMSLTRQHHMPMLCLAICLFYSSTSPTVVHGFSFRTTTTTISSSLLPLRSSSSSSTTQEHTTTTTTPPQIDWTLLDRDLNSCPSGTVARRILERTLRNGGGDDSVRFSSVRIPPGASDRPISDGDLAIQTRIRNGRHGIFELIDTAGDKDADRAAAAILSVSLFSSWGALAANDTLFGTVPETVRFVVVWLCTFAPLMLVGYGIATPRELQSLLVAMQRNLFPTYRTRMLQHEAGHFLMAHLLGLPIQGYHTNAVRHAVEFYPLNDPNVGTDRASRLGFDAPRDDGVVSDDVPVQSNPDAPFFSKEGRGVATMETRSVFRKSNDKNFFLQLPSQMEPTQAWPYRGITHSKMDQLAVVSVAGVCAEILAFGNAEGGVADFSQLRQLFAATEPELTERDMEHRIRFAVGFAMTQLRLHLGALDALAEVMDRGGSVAECIKAIETCPNVSGQDGITGDYDVRRRHKFRSLGVNVLEKLLLSEKTADAEETRFVQGAGGGYKKEHRLIPAITGDDPLYIALGVAFVFLAWATSGGLSLH